MGKCNFRVSVILIVENENKVCLLRRFNTGWNDGKYAVMGGHVEDGENPVVAVIREAKEELGIVVKEHDLTQVFTLGCSPDHIYIYFKCSKYEGVVKNNEPDQCDDVQFFDVNNLPENMIDQDKLALTHIYGDGATYDSFGY